MGRVVLGILLIIIGLSYLVDVNLWQYFWPAILILGGVYLLLGRPWSGHYYHNDWSNKKHPPRWREGQTVDGSEEKSLHYSALFQGIDRKIITDDFQGGSVNSTFGGVNLDLRGAKIKSKNPVTLKIDATLGGIKIMVPRTWMVVNNITGVAGGVSDSTIQPAEKDKNGTLKLFGQATLGGVEITN